MAKRYRYSLVLLPLLSLCGCTDSAPPTATSPPAPPPGQGPPNANPVAAAGAPLPPPAPAALPATAAVTANPPSPPPDPSFTPLPTPEQVKRAQPIGQLDPFRPLSQEIRDIAGKPKARPASSPVAVGASARPPARPQPLEIPPGLEITGVIGGVGRPEAVISYQGANGTVRVGDVGSAAGKEPNATNLLPEGWGVAAIDLSSGSIVLEFKGQRMRKQI